jgi:hypothetical protein
MLNEEENKLKKEYYEIGVKDGIERSKQDSYNDGFRDGVQKGLELGLYEGFFENIRKLIEKDKNKKGIDKIFSILNNENLSKEENLSKKYKIITTNLKMIYKKYPSKEE